MKKPTFKFNFVQLSIPNSTQIYQRPSKNIIENIAKQNHHLHSENEIFEKC